MKDFLGELYVLLLYPKNIVLLVARLFIAHGFSQPALMKISDMRGTINWFDSIGIPFPTLFAYLVSGLESMGIILLILGLLTRYISMLLASIMVGAIAFVHIEYGFSASDGGFEIPLYYFIILVIFATFGAGKYSMDRLLFEEKEYE